jgi:hypothetical protein
MLGNGGSRHGEMRGDSACWQLVIAHEIEDLPPTWFRKSA